MHGNVPQWCEDLYNPNGNSKYHVIRGGSYGSTGTGGSEAALRIMGLAPPGRGFGFRLARTPSGGE